MVPASRGVSVSPALLLAMCIVFAIAYGLAAWIRVNAVALGMFDEPNERSSHAMPTPRGGGLGIVLGFLVIGVSVWAEWLSLPPLAGLPGVLSAGVLLGVIGFIDDRGHVPASLRLLAHAVSAGLALYAIGVPEFSLPLLGVPAEGLRALILLLAIVWLINLYNFMDGIDGIATVEAITTLAGVAILILASGGDVEMALTWPLLLSTAAAGFLIWNWSPAKLFMGDAASGFLGFILAAMVLDAAVRFGVNPVAGLILLGVFVGDASWTLLRRLLRRQRLHQAHRSHAYQRASRLWISRLVEAGEVAERARVLVHRRISLIVGAVNLGWLLPWALLATRSPDWAWSALLIAYLPLVLLAQQLRAGVIDD